MIQVGDIVNVLDERTGEPLKDKFGKEVIGEVVPLNEEGKPFHVWNANDAKRHGTNYPEGFDIPEEGAVLWGVQEGPVTMTYFQRQLRKWG